MFHVLGNCIFSIYAFWRCFNEGVVMNITIILISFFVMIAFVAYITSSPWALLGLLLMPSLKLNKDDK